MGPFQFGIFSYFQAIVSMLLPFSVLGVDYIIRSKIVYTKKKIINYIVAGIQIKIILSIALIVSILSFIFFTSIIDFPNQLILFFFSLSLLFRSLSLLEILFDNDLRSIVNSSIRSISLIITCSFYQSGFIKISRYIYLH